MIPPPPAKVVDCIRPSGILSRHLTGSKLSLPDRAYPILASLVMPRPIALVTTISPEGKVNAAPFSFFNVLGADPPILAVAPGDRDDGTPKDTARNIRLTHEFVVNLVDEALSEAMNKCAASLPYGETNCSMPDCIRSNPRL